MNPMPTEHPQPPPPADAATSDEQIQQTAEEILDTGVRPIIADDYDARAVKFGEEIANLPPEDRARLIQELMRQDPGALHSWLEMDIIDRMQNEGLISQDEFSAIAQGFVDAYNEGRLTQQQAETFLQVASLQQAAPRRSEEHTSDLQSLMRNSYAAVCL